MTHCVIKCACSNFYYCRSSGVEPPLSMYMWRCSRRLSKDVRSYSSRLACTRHCRPSCTGHG